MWDDLINYLGGLWNGVTGNNPTALGNPASTVNVVPKTVNGFTPINPTDIAPLLANNQYTSMLSPQAMANYMNANKLSIANLNNSLSTVDGSKALASLIQNQNSMMRPNAWSFEGAFGNNNYAGWAGTAIQGLSALGNLYLGYKGLKQNEKALNENIALQRANYRNTARALNNQYRDVMSGRGYNGQSAEAARALGRDYARRKVAETY
nr:MAG: hypothetical protein [Enquatrovirus sp.]